MRPKPSLLLLVLASGCGAEPPRIPATTTPLTVPRTSTGDEQEREETLQFMANAPHVVVGNVRSVEPQPRRINGLQHWYAIVEVEASFRDKTPDSLQLFDVQSPHHAKLTPGARILFTLDPEEGGSFRVRASEEISGDEVPRLRVTLPSLAKELEVRRGK